MFLPKPLFSYSAWVSENLKEDYSVGGTLV